MSLKEGLFLIGSFLFLIRELNVFCSILHVARELVTLLSSDYFSEDTYTAGQPLYPLRSRSGQLSFESHCI